jgi:hypothetical protein
VEEPLFLSPNCALHGASTPPESLAGSGDLLAGFALQGTLAWVEDSRTGALNPFWLGPRLESVVRSLQFDDPAPHTIPTEDLAVLAAAGILYAGTVSQPNPPTPFADEADEFRREGYVPLRNLIHPFHVAALRRYYRHLIRRGRIALGDEQSSRRYVAHNEPVARFFHHQIAAIVSAVAGEPVKPSYVYLASYCSGAALKKHTDREQCEFSVTLCLDFSPEPKHATPWPIRLQTPAGETIVYQALGDGLMYRGTKLPHYRHVLPDGQSSTSIFFHYVSVDFSGSLD